jgi:predicted nuclease of predicted toxin-antitoxin system
MKILLDECLPRQLKAELPGHEVNTVVEMGWSGQKNGALLRLMADTIDVFVTVDKGLPNQQNLQNVVTAVVILRAPSNRFEHLQPLMEELRAVLEDISGGDVVTIGS